MKGNVSVLAVMAVLGLAAWNSSQAGERMTDPRFSTVDGVYYYEPDVECDELKNSESCETFKAVESYSLRDGVSYTDCTIDCDDLFESDGCFSFRKTYPCTDGPSPVIAIMDSLNHVPEFENER